MNHTMRFDSHSIGGFDTTCISRYKFVSQEYIENPWLKQEDKDFIT